MTFISYQLPYMPVIVAFEPLFTVLTTQKLVLGPILRLEPLSLTVPFFVLLYVVVGTRRI